METFSPNNFLSPNLKASSMFERHRQHPYPCLCVYMHFPKHNNFSTQHTPWQHVEINYAHITILGETKKKLMVNAKETLQHFTCVLLTKLMQLCYNFERRMQHRTEKYTCMFATRKLGQKDIHDGMGGLANVHNLGQWERNKRMVQRGMTERGTIDLCPRLVTSLESFA
jgi:hypothetical protein